MSGDTASHVEDGDRRVQRTRRALLDSFVGLVLERNYDEIRVGDIVEEADVGRSTFYEHYRGKDDMLVQSMGPMLDVMADASLPDGGVACLEQVLAHFWENRRHGRYLMQGPPARHLMPRLVHALAERIETRLEARERETGAVSALPPRLMAVQAAEAQFALIRTWLAGAAECSPAELAAGMHRCTIGSITALLCDAATDKETP